MISLQSTADTRNQTEVGGLAASLVCGQVAGQVSLSAAVTAAAAQVTAVNQHDHG